MLDDDLRNAVLLVFANKQDLPNAMSVVEVTDKLGLRELPAERKWNVQASSCTSGNGLYEGLGAQSWQQHWGREGSHDTDVRCRLAEQRA